MTDPTPAQRIRATIEFSVSPDVPEDEITHAVGSAEVQIAEPADEEGNDRAWSTSGVQSDWVWLERSPDTTLTLTMPGMDDCDAAVLVGIIRDGLEKLAVSKVPSPFVHRAVDFLARGPLEATINATITDPSTSVVNGLFLTCPGCEAIPGEECGPGCLSRVALS